VLLLGPTTTGKSQLASALERTLGDYAGIGGPSLFRGNLDDKPRPDLLRVMNCRVALCEEAGHAWQLHEDKVKQVTGGGTMQARRMRSDVFLERVPEFTPVVVANSVPRVKGSDLAVYQRLVVVRFDQRPAREDVHKRERFLEDEGVQRALLRRLVEGCFRAQQVGASADDLPHEFQLERAAAFDDLDDVSQVLRQMQEHGLLLYDPSLAAQQSARTKEFHLAYLDFLKKHGDADAWRERAGLKQFSQRLGQLPGFERDRSDGSRWTGWRVVDPLLWRPE
jgi:phage/plasmid-associated DNA primase